MAFAWPDAYAKARAAAAIFRRRVEMAGHLVDDWLEEYWGVNALHGPTVPIEDADEAPEVIVRLAWRCSDAATAARVGREMAPMALSAPPWGLTGTGRGMGGAPSQLMGLWPALVDKAAVDPGVAVEMVEV